MRACRSAHRPGSDSSLLLTLRHRFALDSGFPAERRKPRSSEEQRDIGIHLSRVSSLNAAAPTSAAVMRIPLLAVVACGVSTLVGLSAFGIEGRSAEHSGSVREHNASRTELTVATTAVAIPKAQIWVRVASDVPVEILARDLNISPQTLAELNQLQTNASVTQGSWIKLPGWVENRIPVSKYFDATTRRSSAPIAIGATRNPTGTEATDSGERTSDNPEKDRIRALLEQRQAREQLSAAEAEERRRQALKQAEEARQRRYRTFGDCTYDWQGWGLSPSGVRSTTAICETTASQIAVDCKNLYFTGRRKTSSLSWSGWGEWKLPQKNSPEAEMVIELCSNLL